MCHGSLGGLFFLHCDIVFHYINLSLFISFTMDGHLFHFLFITLWIIQLWSFSYMSFGECMYVSLLNIFLGMELLVLKACSIFNRYCQKISKWLYQFMLSPIVDKYSSCLTSSPLFDIIRFCLFNIIWVHGWEVLSHRVFISISMITNEVKHILIFIGT